MPRARVPGALPVQGIKVLEPSTGKESAMGWKWSRLKERRSRPQQAPTYRPVVERLEDRCTPSTLPPCFTEAVVAGSLSSGTAMELAPDGKLFVCEQGGTMEVWQGGARLRADFFQNAPISVNSSGERGLLGVAFDPDYATNRFVYVYYTTSTSPIHNRVSRFTANATGDLALAGSETVILELDNLSGATNHNGGALHFGADGKLYIAVGDNADGNNSQDLGNLLGKMLRINKDGTIPTDNPFFDVATGKNRAIWALGLRNPFTFAVQPGTGRIFINDVGQSSWEEINDGAAGANYGWPETEGPFNQNQFPNYTHPFHAYPNDSSTCAITGGVFYNPQTNQFPSDYTGDYFFADFCGNWIRRIDLTTKTVTGFATDASAVVDLRVGPDGSLYYLNRGSNQVFRVVFTAGQAPSITQHPQNKTVPAGQPATFSVNASGAAPLSYQWQRNNGSGFTNIAGATAASYTVVNAQLADSGAMFRVIVSNSFGTATSNAATLTVTPNQAPTATILTPAAGAHYNAGMTINYSGTGTDPETGTLPPGAFFWQVDFHHDDHVHPFIPAFGGKKSGSFVIPKQGETAANVFYRIYLTVIDSAGLTHTTFRDVLPNTVNVDLTSNTTGLQVVLDGQPTPAPASFTGVVGINRTLGAPATPVLEGISYRFWSWSDLGARNHVISTPTVNWIYTSNYIAVSSDWQYKINFQPGTSPVPVGYKADAGLPFGNRGGGLMYGWDTNVNSTARDRVITGGSPGLRYETLVQMQAQVNPNAKWEIQLPNGAYRVHLVAGDLSWYQAVYKIDVEGVPAIDAVPRYHVRWFDNVVTVNVTDGRLTITNAPGAVHNRLNYIEITPVSGLSGFSSPPGGGGPDGFIISQLSGGSDGRRLFGESRTSPQAPLLTPIGASPGSGTGTGRFTTQSRRLAVLDQAFTEWSLDLAGPVNDLLSMAW
jgi:glucose/arabinose dehydrogenase